MNSIIIKLTYFLFWTHFQIYRWLFLFYSFNNKTKNSHCYSKCQYNKSSKNTLKGNFLEVISIACILRRPEKILIQKIFVLEAGWDQTQGKFLVLEPNFLTLTSWGEVSCFKKFEIEHRSTKIIFHTLQQILF